MPKDLNILITGASRGIGNAIAKKISSRANKLFLTSKYSVTIDKAVDELETFFNGDIYCFNVDQADSANAADKFGDWLRKNTDYLDAVILCAGDFVEGKLQEVEKDDFIKNMNTNFNFNYYAVNEMIPMLKKSRYPRIVIIGSTAAYDAYSVPTYSITKWALRGYAVNLRKELMGDGIGVTFISPGATLTDMWADVEIPPKRLLEPDDIAKIVDSLFDLSEQAVVEELIVRPMLGDVDE